MMDAVDETSGPACAARESIASSSSRDHPRSPALPSRHRADASADTLSPRTRRASAGGLDGSARSPSTWSDTRESAYRGDGSLRENSTMSTLSPVSRSMSS